jgi:hypothetical protein
MTLHLKCISNVNMKNKPFFSNNLKKEKWINVIKSNLLSDSNIDDNELIIVCLQDLYAYRTGFLGYLSTLLTSILNKYIPSTFIFSTLSNYFFKSNFKCNDLDTFSGIISILNRSIPFLNYGVWDYKKYISNKLNLFINDNHSINGMLDLNSIFLFKPFFDSGLGILSNKKCEESGFEKLTKPTNKFINEGFLWSYFKDGDKNILVVTLNITKNDDNTSDLKELLVLIDTLLLKFSKNCEIYVLGDFRMELDQCKHLFEDDFKILNNEETQYLLYKNNKFFKNPIYLKTRADVDDENDSILTYNFTKKRSLSPIQKIIHLKKIKYEQEMIELKDDNLKEVKVFSFEENERMKDEDKINFYKNLQIITENPIENKIDNYFDKIDNYFDKIKVSNDDCGSSGSTSSVIDDEWTTVDQII